MSWRYPRARPDEPPTCEGDDDPKDELADLVPAIRARERAGDQRAQRRCRGAKAGIHLVSAALAVPGAELKDEINAERARAEKVTNRADCAEHTGIKKTQCLAIVLSEIGKPDVSTALISGSTVFMQSDASSRTS